MRLFHSFFHSLITTALAGTLMLAGSSTVFAAAPQSESGLLPAVTSQVIHTNSQEQLPSDVRIALLLAQIHSRATLQKYLAGTKMAISPMHYLPSAARQRFLASLTFNENGLTGFYFADLTNLQPSEIYQILNLFGAQYLTAQFGIATVETTTDALIAQGYGPDIKGALYNYECVSRATCGPKANFYCMSDC